MNSKQPQEHQLKIEWLSVLRAAITVALWFAVIYAWVFDHKFTALGLIGFGVVLAVMAEDRRPIKAKLELLAGLGATALIIGVLLFIYAQLLKQNWFVISFALVIAAVGLVAVVGISWNLGKLLALSLARRLAPKLTAWVEREDAQIREIDGSGS